MLLLYCELLHDNYWKDVFNLMLSYILLAVNFVEVMIRELGQDILTIVWNFWFSQGEKSIIKSYQQVTDKKRLFWENYKRIGFNEGDLFGVISPACDWTIPFWTQCMIQD